MNNLSYEIIDYSDTINMRFSIYTAYEALVESHWHKGIEIVYILNGAMNITINENTYTIHKDEFSVVNSMEIHSTKCVGKATVLLLQIPTDAMPVTDRIDCRKYSNNEYTKIFSSLIDIYNTKEKGYYLKFNSVVYDMLYSLFLQFGKTNEVDTITVSTDKEALTKMGIVIDYVQKHYMDNRCLEDVSTLACYNKQYFTRIFKKYIRSTFFDYLNSVRIRHVFEDLIHTDLSISEIAEKNGFSNNKNFQKVFKKSYNCTPSNMRKKIETLKQSSTVKIEDLKTDDII